jgi:hypothetical protein
MGAQIRTMPGTCQLATALTQIEGKSMPDDLTNPGPQDRSRISLLEPHEVQYWAECIEGAAVRSGEERRTLRSRSRKRTEKIGLGMPRRWGARTEQHDQRGTPSIVLDIVKLNKLRP